MNTKPSLKDVATALTKGDYTLLPEGDYSAYTDEQWQFEAQCYLDNLADGYDDDETRADLIGMIAKGIARPAYYAAAFRHDLSQDGWYSELHPFDEWFEPRRDYYVPLVKLEIEG